MATAATTAFCRPATTRPDWLQGLDPYLTLQAAVAYASVDPSRIPCHRLTGAGRLAGGDGFTQLVSVQTDAGPYDVTVSRATAAVAWRVSLLVPTRASR